VRLGAPLHHDYPPKRIVRKTLDLVFFDENQPNSSSPLPIGASTFFGANPKVMPTIALKPRGRGMKKFGY